MSELITYLTTISQMCREVPSSHNKDWKYYSSAECILDEGLHSQGKFVLPKWVKKGVPKECYKNATNLVLHHDHLKYVEGYATFKSIPIEHAWVYDMVTGQFYDSTWIDEDEEREYYGVVFGRDYMMSMMVKTERYGVWGSESYRHLMPVMEEGFPDWAIHKFGINKKNDQHRDTERLGIRS